MPSTLEMLGGPRALPRAPATGRCPWPSGLPVCSQSPAPASQSITNELPVRLAEKVRGRAGRREVQQTRGNSGKNPQVRLLSSVPRAVFLGFPPHRPRWLSVFYPPLWTLAAPGRLARSYGAITKEPGDANCGAGADAASAAARWVCVLHPGPATALRSRLMTPHEALSDGPA